jgi:hypothetical protein
MCPIVPFHGNGAASQRPKHVCPSGAPPRSDARGAALCRTAYYAPPTHAQPASKCSANTHFTHRPPFQARRHPNMPFPPACSSHVRVALPTCIDQSPQYTAPSLAPQQQRYSSRNTDSRHWPSQALQKHVPDLARMHARSSALVKPRPQAKACGPSRPVATNPIIPATRAPQLERWPCAFARLPPTMPTHQQGTNP